MTDEQPSTPPSTSTMAAIDISGDKPPASAVTAPTLELITPIRLPLVDATIYHPGAALATITLAGPTLTALGVLWLGGQIAWAREWLPLALLLWAPALAAMWLTARSVRMTSQTLAVGRTLRRWRVVALREIAHVEQRGLRMVIETKDGGRLAFTPRLLNNGNQLRRGLLLLAPPHSLSHQLSIESARLADGENSITATGEHAGGVTMRAPWRWSMGASAVTLVIATGGAIALDELWPLALSDGYLWAWAIALLAASALCFAGLMVTLWMRQEAHMDAQGMTIRYLALRSEQHMRWRDVRLVEYTRNEWTLTLYAPRPIWCAGPGIYAAPQARLMRWYIARYCLPLGTPVVARSHAW